MARISDVTLAGCCAGHDDEDSESDSHSSTSEEEIKEHSEDEAYSSDDEHLKQSDHRTGVGEVQNQSLMHAPFCMMPVLLNS